MTGRQRLVLALAAVLGVTACGSAAESQQPASAASRAVVVFAAASLTDVFERLGAQFEAAHPGVEVTFSFAASSALAQSILAGAPADVFAAASPATMDVVTRAGAAPAAPTVFARNRLEIAVPAGNPGRVAGLADLGRPELRIALCAPQVPCGAAAREVLVAAGIQAAPDTLEQDVRAALSKVRLGEVDAALVYRTDVRAAGDDVEGIALPTAGGALNDYLVAPLTEAADPATAQAFVAHVLSQEGQRALVDAGFDAA